MEISVIASGSNGNCCLVEEKDISLLIDAGKSGREIEQRMQRLGKSAEDIDGILITHSHSDHISGAGVLARRYGVPIYASKEIYSESRFKLGDVEAREFDVKRNFKIKGLDVKPIATSHNVSSCGYVIGNFGLFTDTGKVTKQVEDTLPKLKGVLLESNHDIDMVLNGPYPVFLKQWILSDKGHLSNLHASSLLQAKGKNLNFALLGHLSGNNNTPEVVKEAFETLVKRKMDFSVCSRDNESGKWEI
ncbi:MBL fold metallo-hydrolase [Candidatus Woesearchaeota archaeon]|nr:MBL fold metallo-hydrolase [Candidatus Woesearchaeota archaeon]